MSCATWPGEQPVCFGENPHEYHGERDVPTCEVIDMSCGWRNTYFSMSFFQKSHTILKNSQIYHVVECGAAGNIVSLHFDKGLGIFLSIRKKF